MTRTAICEYSLCGKEFPYIWGPGATGNRRRYCSIGHSIDGQREKARLAAKRRGWDRASKRKENYRVIGRQCRWIHCQVDDEHHINSWNSVVDVCPSCYRQANRVGSCSRCSGPIYRSPRDRNSRYCPTCEPLTPIAGEVSVTLVCSVTGRERNIVRKPTWKLPDGTLLQDLAKFGFAVIDVKPEVWAKFRV